MRTEPSGEHTIFEDDMGQALMVKDDDDDYDNGDNDDDDGDDEEMGEENGYPTKR